MKNTPCRPLEHLRAAAQLYPAAWDQLDAFRAMRGTELPDWPDWCFCPLAGSYAVVSGGGDNRLALDMVGDVSRIGALAAWRQTKGIYRFDPVLAENLLTTKLSGDLPVELLYRLPEWCVYVETPDLLHGFFAHLEHDSNTGRAELRFLFDFPEALIPVPVHLGPWPLAEAVSRATSEAARQSIIHGNTLAATTMHDHDAEIVENLAPMVSLLLYLCSDQPDYGERKPPGNPRPKKTKRGMTAFPASSPSVIEVGAAIGRAIRTAAAGPAGSGDRSGPRPHIRAAHWHTYLTGKGRASRSLRWIPPVQVNVADLDAVPAKIKKVRP